MISRSVQVSAFAIIAATGASLATLGAFASAAAQDSTDLTEIVVTAKNRTERLQDVPLAITALSSDTLAQASVRDVRDLQKLTPSLNIYTGSSRDNATAMALRGIAPNTSDERFQGIAFFIDGVALSGQVTSLDSSQIERVEIIKGPQSASFGRATYTGAINYITKNPSGDAIHGNIRLRGGMNDGAEESNYLASGYLSGPIIADKLWAAVEGTAMRQGGLVASKENGTLAGRETTKAIAGTLFYKPMDNFSVKLRTSYSHDDDTVGTGVLLHARDFLLSGTSTTRLSRGGNALWPTKVPSGNLDLISVNDKNVDAWLPDGGTERDRYFTSLVASYGIGDYELSYRAGYVYENRISTNSPFTRSAITDPVFGPLVANGQVTLSVSTLPGSRLVARERFVNYSHQLLLLSPSERRLRWKVGGYYFSETSLNNFSSFKTPGNPNGQIRGLETLTNVAAFGSADFDFTNQLTLALEGRYQIEKIGQVSCISCGQITRVDADFEEKNFLPRVTLSYKITPNNMIYGLYSYGVKSGRLSRINETDQFYAKPEKLDNYEIGSKNTFMGGRVLLNVAAFEMKLRDQQLVSTVVFNTPAGGIINLSTTNNAGGSLVRGFEVESSWRATDRLTFGGGIGYAKQEFNTKAPLILSASSAVVFPGAANTPVVLDGKTQANVPSTNGFASVEYVQPDVFRGMAGSVRLDATYRGSFFIDINNVAKVDPSWNFNGRMRLYSDSLEVALYGRNLLDDDTVGGGGLAGGTTACTFIERDTATFGTNQQCVQVGTPRPREIGIELSKRF